MTDSGNPTPDNRQSAEVLSGREVYNVVSDTVTGVNVRVKDNVIQGIVIFIFVVLGAIIGAVMVELRLAGAFVGGFLGLVVGLLASGIVLMVYRAVTHLRGRHD